MLKIIHRINEISKLKDIPRQYGVEIDLRSQGNEIILNHEPFEGGDNFEDYLKNFEQSFIVLNIKEAGIETRVLELAKKYQVPGYFLLDVEHPYLYRASNEGVKDMAVRFSEYEPIELAQNFENKVDWMWIDTATELPITEENIPHLKKFKTCLVCPERWGRPEDIAAYAEKMKALNFKPDAVMTALHYIDEWNKHYPDSTN